MTASITLCATGVICEPAPAVTITDLAPSALLLSGLAVLLLLLIRNPEGRL
ncbi:hypothetical protein WYO_3666 [Methylobacterium sp. GXF4]|uniref:hypothetical protein n=1 Tax=Methylobacterium sp. GXF4 TaxID=1096546 RepID=UPI0002697CE0|nr:hypothetical protein [Methylobacterium sp. GXF4]EIZ83653.1 hypothetical protein WYO_3666 [Methylobacterium sp. GXF4]